MISRRQFSTMALALAAAPLTGCAVPSRAVPVAAITTATPAVQQVEAGELNIGYVEAGPADGPAIILLHGWPYDIHSYTEVIPVLAAAGHRVIVPYLRGYGSTTFRAEDTFRNAQQAAVARDVVNLMDALHVDKAVIGGFDWGSRTAAIVAALWPQRCTALVAVSGYLITNRAAQAQPLPPAAELGWWYQYYFATERGVLGYARNTREFNKLIWRNASPQWAFSDATYEQTAAAFDNPDHARIVIHNYRWRLGLADGDSQYDDLEQRLAAGPTIAVPTITVASDFDGAAANGDAYRAKFTGPYDHRILPGIGHNVPQEAPSWFARAVLAATQL
jgi:pimeloyl-ACP methyl ester carboxylesterase